MHLIAEKNIFHRLLIVMITAFSLLLAIPAMALTPQEEIRVDKLLTELGKQSSISFIRNDTEYNAVDAESHLRLKLGKTKKRLKTTEQFIDNVASKSSISGSEYQVKISDQQTVTANQYLHDLLKKVDTNK
nr:DUF5329 family protein [uncultured Moellerella sp.]